MGCGLHSHADCLRETSASPDRRPAPSVVKDLGVASRSHQRYSIFSRRTSMHSLHNRFLHVAVLSVAVAGALIVGAMRPTQSSAQGGIVIPAADQVNVFCIQDDRYP